MDNLPLLHGNTGGGVIITKSQIQTFTGIGFDPLAPDPNWVDIRDIAHALSNQCRFSGHIRMFYSVASHSVACATVEDPSLTDDDRRTLLMHDAAEAYLLDMPRPLKEAFPQYAEFENRLMEAIAARFKFGWPMTPAQKVVDDRMLFTEKRDLLQPRDWGYEIEPYPGKVYHVPPTAAENQFLIAFASLFGANR